MSDGHNATYVVLQEQHSGVVGSEGAWSQIGPERVAAPSAEAAIRRVVDNLVPTSQNGTYVAVPARSWRPVKVSAALTTVLKLDPT